MFVAAMCVVVMFVVAMVVVVMVVVVMVVVVMFAVVIVVVIVFIVVIVVVAVVVGTYFFQQLYHLLCKGSVRTTIWSQYEIRSFGLVDSMCGSCCQQKLEHKKCFRSTSHFTFCVAVKTQLQKKDCLLAGSLACSLACLLACLPACSLAGSLACLLDGWPACLLACCLASLAHQSART